MSALMRVWNFILDIFMPPLCVSCRAYLSGDERDNLICAQCFSDIPIYKTFFYAKGGFTLFTVSSYASEPLRDLLHSFKYKRLLGAKMPIAKLVSRYLDHSAVGTFLSAHYSDSVIVPIPLHGKRLRKRGFNQADAIAEILGRELFMPVAPRALKRIRDTQQQTKMKNRTERAENIENCFEINGRFYDIPRGGTVILVDDVYTSGATMHEAAKTLRRAGVKEIIGFTIAKTP